MSHAQAAKYSGLNIDTRGDEMTQRARISQGVLVLLCQKMVIIAKIDVSISLIKIIFGLLQCVSGILA